MRITWRVLVRPKCDDHGAPLPGWKARWHSRSIAFRGPPRNGIVFVRAQTGWTHFHRLGLVARSSDGSWAMSAPALAARDAAGTLEGVLPLVRVKSLVFGHFLVSQPFVNYGGPLGCDDAIRALVAEAERHGCGRWGVKLLELRSPASSCRSSSRSRTARSRWYLTSAGRFRERPSRSSNPSSAARSAARKGRGHDPIRSRPGCPVLPGLRPSTCATLAPRPSRSAVPGAGRGVRG